MGNEWRKGWYEQASKFEDGFSASITLRPSIVGIFIGIAAVRKSM
jgi:hypothetical protein